MLAEARPKEFLDATVGSANLNQGLGARNLECGAAGVVADRDIDTRRLKKLLHYRNTAALGGVDQGGLPFVIGAIQVGSLT